MHADRGLTANVERQEIEALNCCGKVSVVIQRVLVQHFRPF